MEGRDRTGLRVGKGRGREGGRRRGKGMEERKREREEEEERGGCPGFAFEIYGHLRIGIVPSYGAIAMGYRSSYGGA